MDEIEFRNALVEGADEVVKKYLPTFESALRQAFFAGVNWHIQRQQAALKTKLRESGPS